MVGWVIPAGLNHDVEADGAQAGTRVQVAL
jgi:hypothetical protein